MQEFFRGWKRKIGVVMLLTACTFMVGWVRSQRAFDIVSFPIVPSVSNGIGSGTLLSWRRGILWVPRPKKIGSRGSMLPRWKTLDPSIARELVLDLDGLLESPSIRWRWKWQGIGMGELIEEPGTSNVWHFLIPYWSIVLPLTLLSAWLLLSKPRRTAAIPSGEVE